MRYRERSHEKRIAYLRNLRKIVAERGIESIVYIDESGFESESFRASAWGKIGQKIYGERKGSRGKRTNLIAARKGKKFLAPTLFEGTANTALVNAWVEQQLCQNLPPGCTFILDNARFHKKEQLTEIAEKYGHYVLFLPPYSPDFNPIEKDFANIKKRRQFAPQNTPLEEIIKMYNC